MDEDTQVQEQGVNEVEETTAASPAENQTSETTQEETQGDSTESKAVPYDRFAEVVHTKKELEAKIAEMEARLAELQAARSPQAEPDPQEEIVKQTLEKYLRDLGYVKKEELEQQEADRRLQETIRHLEKKYDGKNGLPKFKREEVIKFAQEHLIGDLEVAYKTMHEAEIIDAKIKQVLGKTKGVKTEASDGSGSANVGTTHSDLLQQVARGDENALRTLIKRVIK
ncbi:MAG: hypothetical protein D6822_00150 [Cyanobacteria bacterium J149]|nr:MAG: hypothetical protein D6822_00150 [Cyanobacteria bacterium J149]